MVEAAEEEVVVVVLPLLEWYMGGSSCSVELVLDFGVTCVARVVEPKVDVVVVRYRHSASYFIIDSGRSVL